LHANLSKSELRIYQHDFIALDTDRRCARNISYLMFAGADAAACSGYLDEDEMKVLLTRQMGTEPTAEALRGFFQDVDKATASQWLMRWVVSPVQQKC